MKARFRSILSRIVWLHIVALTIVAVGLSIAASVLLDLTVNNLEERILRDRAAVVAQHLDLRDGTWALSLPPDLQDSYGYGYAGFALSVVDRSGRVIYSSFPDGRALFAPETISSRFVKGVRNGSIYYGANVPVTQNGASAWIQIAQNQENPDVIVDEVSAKFIGRFILAVAPVLALLLVLDIIIVRRALAPINEASKIASSIRASNIDIRLPIAGLPREVQPLAIAINQALERLEIIFQLQSGFIADAAHELRTPLTVLRTQVDMLADRDAAQALQVDIDAMSRVVAQLLELAELEAGTMPPSERMDLNAVCADVVAAMAPLALSKHKALGFTAAPNHAWALGNGDMLFRAVRNLVDNAIRHTREHTQVEVEVAFPRTITVTDCGPGVAVADRATIFQRFWRKDRRDRAHSGLGLSIVAEVARLHGAVLEVDNHPTGGAVFRMILPPPDSDTPARM